VARTHQAIPAAAHSRVSIEALDHRNPALAEAIHKVWSLAYAQEAALMGVQHFAPLQRSVQDIQGSAGFYLGAFVAGELMGVLCIEPDDEPAQLCIAALVVHPKAQRQGIGRGLVREALRRGEGMPFAVSTGARNGPALALYRALGFVAYRYGTLGPEAVDLVKLRWSPADPPV
jgi:ribosomal protein S18 acetylase RimI-like enzyme